MELFFAGIVYAAVVGLAIQAKNGWIIAAALLSVPSMLAAQSSTETQSMEFWLGALGLALAFALFAKGVART